jgi:hypothetical protein
VLCHAFPAHCFQCRLHKICRMWTSIVMEYDDHPHLPRSLLSNCLVYMIEKGVTTIWRINCYATWKNINMNHSFWTPEYSCHDLASWVLCLEVSVSAENLLYHKHLHVTSLLPYCAVNLQRIFAGLTFSFFMNLVVQSFSKLGAIRPDAILY